MSKSDKPASHPHQFEPKDELDDTLAWLEELALNEEGESEDVLASSSPSSKGQDIALESDEQLDWLDDVSTAAERVMEEPPTLSWEHTKPTKDLVTPSLPLGEKQEEDLDQAFRLLETPTEQVSEPKPVEQAASSPSLFGFGQDDFSVSAEEIAAAAESGLEIEGFEMPEDPEEAMAWLEGILGDELVADSTPTTPPPPETSPDVVSAAMTEAPPAAEPIQEVPPPKRASGMFGGADDEEFKVTAEELEAAVQHGVQVEGFDVPDDDEAAMAWLADLLDDDGDGDSLFAELGGAEDLFDLSDMPPASAEEVVPADTNFDPDVELPEDPEEAMALLERLAAEQPDVLADELPEVEAFTEEEMRDPILPIESDEMLQSDEPLVDEAPSVLSWLDGADDDQGENRVSDSHIEEVESLLVENTADLLPDWLSQEPSSDLDALSWLDDTIGSGDGGVLGWLVAEEEVAQNASEIIELPPEIDIYTAPHTPTSSPVSVTDTPAPPEALAQPKPIYDATIFKPARSMLSVGDIEGALEEYQNYLNDGDNVLALIDELENNVQEVGKYPLLRRLLGDAYMQNGQLGQALETYLIVRDQL